MDKIKAIFFDIDGTLRDFEEKGISDGTRQALREAREAGLRLCIATGRHWLEIREENLLADLEFDAYVTLTGQLCYLREEGAAPGRLTFANPIPEDQVEGILEMIRQEPFPCLFMEEDRMYINFVNDRVKEVQQGIGTAVPPVADIRRALEHPVYQIIPYVDRALAERITGRLTGCAYALWHDGNALDLLPAGGGKALGIAKILEHWGLSGREAAAVGDGGNDVSMLRYAGVGIAMGNGGPEVKAAADYVTAPVGAGGLLEAVRFLTSGAYACGGL